ncbi:reverse transcriptase domain-containing protein [Frigoriglobus tundricola]|uniref:Reverse transcriptase domain-containing protein n=1 Tax=Frigoriglobus tundricola TaxID=2774151 RepID=A0A6M5YKV4_9BACT|nr:reverse transcriptase domain-containing protein [Frigoriglobus tundricola]QJW94608.1 hypothetical protein FTUN_2130 [Frigoriglobus tundricola]
MSEKVTADLPHDPCAFASVLFHAGHPEDVLNRWVNLLRTVSPRGWDAVKVYAPEVMNLIADPRVLFVAAVALRARGPKAPGRNGLPLDALCTDELWKMCTALGHAIRAGTYRPGTERVRWVEKASLTGKRPIVISDVQDKVVQKAAERVLRSMLDPHFDPLSFAFRPSRGRFEAMAVAEQLARSGHPVWVTHDLVDAFRRVPVPRLMEVFFKLLPCPRLRAFLGMVLPAQSRAVGGIKQGGPLSPLALEVYLTHVLHGPWRGAGLPVRLLRYADDLLLTAADENTACAADAALRVLLAPTGMRLKHTFEEARCDLRSQPAEWLGFRFRLDGDRFRIDLGARAFEKLGRRFVLAHAKARSADRAVAVLRHWVDQLGPCFPRKKREVVCTKAILTAQEHGFEETVGVAELVERWEASAERWKAIRRRVRRNPGYLVEAALSYPTPTSNVW